MNAHDDLAQLVEQDNYINPDTIEIVVNEKDPLHVQRKQQQRAITRDMLLIALHYGRRKKTYQDWSYTLLDRSLFNTPYEKHLDKLRGLTIIGTWEDDKFHIITSYWNFLVKQRKRY